MNLPSSLDVGSLGTFISFTITISASIQLDKAEGHFYASALIIADIVELGGRLATLPIVLSPSLPVILSEAKNLDPSLSLRVTKETLSELVVWGLAGSKFGTR